MSKNYDCLFVSYAPLGNDYTSWVDLIPIRDLDEAIRTKRLLTIKLVNLSTMKHVKAECTVVSGFDEDNDQFFSCDLVFGPTEHNLKEDIEQGTLTIEWDVPAEGGTAIYSSPTRVGYRQKGKTTAVLPSFSYLQHRDNTSQYFLFVDYKGAAKPREEIFYVEEFEKNRAKFSPDDYEEVYGYVKREVEKLTEFSVGTRWPNPWPKELTTLYTTLNDEDQSAFFLSGLVQKAVMESPYEWTACKVRLYNRDRRTLYFYRTEKLKEVE